MFAIFKDVIRTKEQKSRYVWGKMVTALFCGGAAFKYVTPYVVPFIGDWAIAVGVIGFFLAYVTVAPIIAFLLCLLEELLKL
ncbi:MAG: hypothetical protein RIQ94_2597 [Pseudomonadota bacterium]|jgi:hypothetical protein